MDKFGYFTVALTLGFAIDAFANLSNKSIDRGYDSELKAGDYGSMRFTRNEPTNVAQTIPPAEELKQ